MDMHQMIGKEVADARNGDYAGMVESVKWVTADGDLYPAPFDGQSVPVLMVRHLQGDMAVQPYEAREVKPHGAAADAGITWGPVAETLQSVLLGLAGSPAWDYVMQELAEHEPEQYRMALAVRGSGHEQDGW